MSVTVHMGDPKVESQLVSGFHGIEADAWRWTEQEVHGGPAHAVRRRPEGREADLKLTVPPVAIEKLKTISLSATAGGNALPPETYTKPGDYLYVRDIPAGVFTGDTVRVDFQLDKAMPPSGADLRELGIIVFEHRSGKQMSPVQRGSQPVPRSASLTSAVFWLGPSLLCLALYWRGFTAWFRADDFAWLGTGIYIQNFRDFLLAMFAPQGAGHHPAVSERAFFMRGSASSAWTPCPSGSSSSPRSSPIWRWWRPSARASPDCARRASSPPFSGYSTARSSSPWAGPASTTR